MTLLRWITFLPVGGVLIATAQFLAITVAEAIAWWISAPLILFFGALIAMSSLIPVRIAPNRLVGAAILLALFILFEGIALASILPQTQFYPGIIRVYTDVAIVAGAIIGVKLDRDGDFTT